MLCSAVSQVLADFRIVSRVGLLALDHASLNSVQMSPG